MSKTDYTLPGWKFAGKPKREGIIRRWWKWKRYRYRGDDLKTFTIKVKMPSRWIPHFLAMLNYMQTLGVLGASRTVSFYADGDGDFRPRFLWSSKLNDQAAPAKHTGENHFYDAG